MTFRSIDPATGEVIAEYAATPAPAVRAALARAAAAFAIWRERGFADRAMLLRRVAALLRERKSAVATLMTREMGKPFAQGVAEAKKCAWACEFYADNAERFLTSVPVEADATTSYVAWRPLGPVLAIMPWNFPYWQVFRFLAPALMAGNVALLKHAANVSGCALDIGKLLADAGAPPGLLEVLLVGHEDITGIIEAPEVAAVTLTGSPAAGRHVAAAAGRALKKTVLELGGSDAYIILADAELDDAVQACVTGRLINSGQSCIAAKRFIVTPDIAEAFVARFVAVMRRRGDEIGPLARRDLRATLHDQVRKSVAAGATVLLGGAIPPGPGAWYPATVLDGVAPGMPAYDEELFGPVAAVIRATDDDDAIRIANDTSFGLGAAVFTRDTRRGDHIARERLEAGGCFVNTHVRSDPRLPFGGIKDSGYGRELSVLGIREFVNAKTVYVA